MRRIAIAVVAGLLLTSTVAPGVVAGLDPRFEAHVGQSVLAPGQSTELAVTLQNDAEDPEDTVDPAHDVTATMRAGDTPFTINSGTRVLGTVRDGHPVTTTFAIAVPRGIQPGTYHVPIDVTYEYDVDERETETVYATITVPDRAVFAVVDSTSDVPVGGDGPVSLTIENVGTEAARDATVDLSATAGPITFDGSKTAARYVGSWAPGERRTVTVTATVAPSADATAYPLTGTVAFDDPDGNRRQSAPLPAFVTPEDRRFGLETADSSVQVGGDGVATFIVTNEGDRGVDGVALEIRKTGPDLHPSQTTYPLGDLAPGASTEARVPIAVSNATEPGPREITAAITAADGDGDRVHGEDRTLVVPVSPMQSFDVQVVENTLRVDREGDLTLEVTNAGPQPVQNANLRITDTAPSVHPKQHEYAVGTLEPGQTTTVTFDVDVGDGATPTPRTMTLAMAYDDADGDRRTARPQVVRVDIGPERPIFDLAVEEGTVPAGGSGTVTVRVTNTGEATLRGIDAKAFTDAPYTVTDDSAFVAGLGPGESTTIQFGVAIPGDAGVKDYPLSVDLQYQEPDGESKLTDTYDLPVSVTESRGAVDRIAAIYGAVTPGQDLFLGGLAGVGVTGLVLGSVGVWRRRRDDE